MKELRIGVVGCGAIGREHIRRLNTKVQGTRVTAVYDVFEEGAQKVAAEWGARAFTDVAALVNSDEVDAVVVTSPGFAHKEPVMLAVQAGKPVFCEKPMATTAADCREIVDAEIAGGKHLVQVGFMRRYDKGYRQVKALLDSGKYGKPLLLHCTHRNATQSPTYTTEMCVHDTAIHEIDCLHWLVDDDWESVQVMFAPQTGLAHETLRDPQLMLLRSKRGILVELEVFACCQFGYDINCEVVCESGAITMPSPLFPSVKVAGKREEEIEMSWINRFIESYDVELEDWASHAAKLEVAGPSAWDGYMAAVTADALVKSQKTLANEKVVLGDRPVFYGK